MRRRLVAVNASGRRSFKTVHGRLDESFDGLLGFAYLTCGFGGGGQIRIPGTERIRDETTAIAAVRASGSSRGTSIAADD
jgi:hypothetical protein